ncbi:MAG: hypothetical protein GEU80_01590 [Dehalococcoidia bacterium]|nr:hypothetical protein [Dehalococcoidia bacterium]
MRVYVEPRSVTHLDGVEVDYAEDAPGQGRLVFHNPNPLWRDEREQTVQRLFDEQINPQIAAHGGVVNLQAVEGDTAYIEFGGGCVGCGMLNVTLKQGVEVAIFDAEPSITRVVDSTDHASGSNPYYKPSKK